MSLLECFRSLRAVASAATAAAISLFVSHTYTNAMLVVFINYTRQLLSIVEHHLTHVSTIDSRIIQSQIKQSYELYMGETKRRSLNRVTLPCLFVYCPNEQSYCSGHKHLFTLSMFDPIV
jgi:hypothetical protein